MVQAISHDIRRIGEKEKVGINVMGKGQRLRITETPYSLACDHGLSNIRGVRMHHLRVAKNIACASSKTSPNYRLRITELSPKYHQNFAKPSPTHRQKNCKTSPKHPTKTSPTLNKTSPAHHQNISNKNAYAHPKKIIKTHPERCMCIAINDAYTSLKIANGVRVFLVFLR